MIPYQETTVSYHSSRKRKIRPAEFETNLTYHLQSTNDCNKMSTLTLQDFLPYLEPYANKETLNPAEASQLLLKIAELILDYTVDSLLLKFISRFLTPEAYDEALEERNIEHQCGYPVCKNLPKHEVRRHSSVHAGVYMNETATKYQIYNRKPSMILPNTYLSQYCCKEHYQASHFYRNQLSTEALFLRKNVTAFAPFANPDPTWYENSVTCLEDIIAKHRELREQGKTLSDVIAMMSGLAVLDTATNPEIAQLVELIEDFGDFEIVDHETSREKEVNCEDPSTASRAIEGYVTDSRSYGGYVV